MTESNLQTAKCDAALATISVSYVAFAYLAAAYKFPHFPVCPFRLVTGSLCPLCGSTRMIGTALRGEVQLSWDALPSLAWFVFVLAVAIVSTLRVLVYLFKLHQPNLPDG